MKSLFVCFIFLGFWHDAAVLGDAFEYECDILKKLDYLESKAKTSDERIAELESKAKTSDERIAELESKDKEKQQLLNYLKNTNDALTSKVAELEKSNDTLTNQLQENSLCPEGWKKNSCSCYYIGELQLHFPKAQEICTNHSAKLVHVNDVTENDFLKSFIKEHGVSSYWIGLTDEAMEGTWRWTDDGTVADFTDWFPGEPNDFVSYNCVWSNYGYSYKWLTASCSGRNAYPLCEKGLN